MGVQAMGMRVVEGFQVPAHVTSSGVALEPVGSSAVGRPGGWTDRPVIVENGTVVHPLDY
ncbi:hypothetical protein Acsp03_28470 [Actinomadura sp. NBRC 104412]|nr:hypothetical protein Acsp03_28470 [Actinomadura sp. NBRC 104412]